MQRCRFVPWNQLTAGCWLRPGCVASPRIAAICTIDARNHSESERFRARDATLNLRVVGSIPTRLTTFALFTPLDVLFVSCRPTITQYTPSGQCRLDFFGEPMLRIGVGWILAGVVLLLVGCRRGGPALEKLPREFIVVNGATDVRTSDEGNGRYGLMYQVEAAFPAKAITDQIRAALAPSRWQPLSDDWLNPGHPGGYSRGWTSFGDATKSPQEFVHVWNAQWRDEAGDIIDYSIRYRSPLPARSLSLDTPANSTLYVLVGYTSASVVTAMRKALDVNAPLK